jgi:RNA methyltransferase, TrmH family
MKMRPSPAPRAVTSLQNEQVKFIRSLELRKVRRETGLFVAEGAAVLHTARERGWSPQALVFLAGSLQSTVQRDLLLWAQAAGADCLAVSPAVLAKLAAKDNPQTMLGVFAQRWVAEPVPGAIAPSAVWLALEEIRDPGNLGSIIRTVDAVGAGGIVLVGTCCDPYSRECVRATMGSIFTVPLVPMAKDRFCTFAARWPGEVAGTHLGAHADFRGIEYRLPTLLLMGSEGPGLSADLAGACSRLIKIPMAGRLDSLNLAVAAALVLYEVRRPQLKL